MVPGLSLRHPHINRGVSVRNSAQTWLRRPIKGTSVWEARGHPSGSFPSLQMKSEAWRRVVT